MTVFAYLRVSTDAQDVANQRHGVEAFCTARGWSPAYVEDKVSGRVEWRERQLGQLLDGANQDDVLVVSEVSRLARTTLQVLEIVRRCVEQGVSLYVVKAGLHFDGGQGSKIIVTMLGLLAELERDLISSRTKEALAKRKADGVQLGRKKGQQMEKLKLDPHRKLIAKRLAERVPLRHICREVGCTAHTLYSWLDRRGMGNIRQQELDV